MNKCVRKIHRTNQLGASLVEVMFAVAITLTALMGASHYIETTTSLVNDKIVLSGAKKYESVFRAKMTEINEDIFNDKPCMASLNLPGKFRANYSKSGPDLRVRRFATKDVRWIKDTYFGGHDTTSPEWKDLLLSCNSVGGSYRACAVMQAFNTNNKLLGDSLAIVYLENRSVDFMTYKTPASCSDSAIKDPSNVSEAGVSVGIKTNYAIHKIIKAKSLSGTGRTRFIKEWNRGELFFGSSKKIPIVTASSSPAKPNLFSTCDRDSRCSTPIPPNPRIDYEGWLAFPNPSGNTHEDYYCGSKGERTSTYK